MSIGDFPPHVQEFLQDQQALLGRLPATHHIVTRRLETPLEQGTLVPSESIVVRWTEAGIVQWMAGQDRVIDDLFPAGSNFKSSMVRIQCGGLGQEDLFMGGGRGIPGEAPPNYVTMFALFAGIPSNFTLNRRVHPGVDWTINYVNVSTIPGVSIDPQLLFGFISDADLASLASQAPRAGSKARPAPNEETHVAMGPRGLTTMDRRRLR